MDHFDSQNRCIHQPYHEHSLPGRRPSCAGHAFGGVLEGLSLSRALAIDNLARKDQGKMSAGRDSFTCFVNSTDGKELASLVVKEDETVVESSVG